MDHKTGFAIPLPPFSGKHTVGFAIPLPPSRKHTVDRTWNPPPSDFIMSQNKIDPYANNFLADSSKIPTDDKLLTMNEDCISFMTYVRSEVTGDSGDFIVGSNEDFQNKKYLHTTYFSKNLFTKWEKPGFWCFILRYDAEAGFEPFLLHSWSVSVIGNEIQIYMTGATSQEITYTSETGEKVTRKVCIPYSYFKEMLKHVDYIQWTKSIVEMVQYIQKNSMDDEACLMYENLFGIRNLRLPRKSIRLYWKCYYWNDSSRM